MELIDREQFDAAEAENGAVPVETGQNRIPSDFSVRKRNESMTDF